MKKVVYCFAALSLFCVNSSWGTGWPCPGTGGPCPGKECEEGYVETSWLDEITDDVTVSKGDPYSYQHIIIDNGFTPGVDTITEASLDIDFSGGDWHGFADIDLPGSKDDKKNFFISGDEELEIELGSYSLDLLEKNGFLDVTIAYKGIGWGCKSWDCNFDIINSKLTAHGCEPVPEPAAMLLYGAGITGLAGVSRRRLKI